MINYSPSPSPKEIHGIDQKWLNIGEKSKMPVEEAAIVAALSQVKDIKILICVSHGINWNLRLRMAGLSYDAGPCTQRERPAFGEEAKATRAMRGEARQLGLLLAGLSTRGQCPLP